MSGAHIDQNFDRKKEEDSRKERQDKLKEKENFRVSTKKKEEKEEKRGAYKRDTTRKRRTIQTIERLPRRRKKTWRKKILLTIKRFV